MRKKIDYQLLNYAGEYLGMIESKKRYSINQISKLSTWIHANLGDYIINVVKHKKATKIFKFILIKPIKLDIICMEIINK